MLESPKILIITTARSGSNYLYTLLSSHSRIFCEGEIFNHTALKNKHHTILIKLIQQFPITYIKHRISVCKKKNKPIYGFKLFPFQLECDIKPFLTQLQQQGFKLIYLTRRNKISQIISYMVASQKSQWVVQSSNEYSDEKINLNLDSLSKVVAYYQKTWQALNQLKETFHGLELVYEDDLASPEMIEQLGIKLAHFLSVPIEPLKSKLIKTDRRSDAARISNLNEFIDQLRNMGLHDEVNYYLRVQEN